MEANDIITNLNYLLEKVFKSIEGEIFKTLDKLTIIGPEILKEEPLKNIVFENKVNGLVIIANTLILFFVIYYVFKELIGIYNGNKIETIYVFIIRIIIVCIIVNFSYYICEEILNIFGILGESIDTYASDLINRKVTFENLKDSIINIENIINTDLVSLDGIIKGIISFGSVSILISFSVRYVTVIFLIIISPLAFVCLSSNLTSGIFNMWVKMLIVNLTLQIGIKLLIFIPLAYKNQNDIIYKIILVGTISLIYKFNIFIKELLARISNENNVKNIFKD